MHTFFKITPSFENSVEPDQLVSSHCFFANTLKIARSYLRVPQAAWQVKILIFLVKIIFFPYMSIVFVMQGKSLFSDISRPALD